MSKSNALVAFALVVIVILFGFLIITLGETRQVAEEPEITEFEDKGITDYFAGENEDDWNVTSRQDQVVTIEGTTVQTGFVDSLEPLDAERTENGTIRVTVGVNRSYSSPVHVQSTEFSGDGQAVSVYPPQPIPLTYGYEMTVENVLENEEVVVEVVEMEDEQDSQQQ